MENQIPPRRQAVSSRLLAMTPESAWPLQESVLDWPCCVHSFTSGGNG